MNSIQIFSNPAFGSVRTVDINGKPYFVANDVARALGYSNPSKATNDHCKNVMKMWGNDSLGRPTEFKVIPEGDIYRLVIKSQLPTAEKFERWVFDEVLPSIRGNGGYVAGQESLTDDELLERAVMVAQRKIAERDKAIAEKDAKIREMRPKEVFADAVAVSRTSILVGDLAKLIAQNGVDIGQKRLFAWMRDNGYLIKRKGSDWNMPTQYSMKLKLFEVKESTVSNPDGSVRITRTTKVTGKGQGYFINKFLDQN